MIGDETLPDDRPVRWINQSWNNGKPRWGFSCDGCDAKVVGITTQSAAHTAALAHKCPEVTS